MKLLKGYRVPLQNGYTISRKSVEGIGYFARLSPSKKKIDMYWVDKHDYAIVVTIESRSEIEEAKKLFLKEVQTCQGMQT